MPFLVFARQSLRLNDVFKRIYSDKFVHGHVNLWVQFQSNLFNCISKNTSLPIKSDPSSVLLFKILDNSTLNARTLVPTEIQVNFFILHKGASLSGCLWAIKSEIFQSFMFACEELIKRYYRSTDKIVENDF